MGPAANLSGVHLNGKSGLQGSFRHTLSPEEGLSPFPFPALHEFRTQWYFFTALELQVQLARGSVAWTSLGSLLGIENPVREALPSAMCLWKP